jgi:hypothetical protein
MAQVTLNKNSWHFKYYSMIVSDTPPKTLCPYFWTMVSLIFISPVIGVIIIIKYVSLFFDKIVPKKEKKEKSYEQIEMEWKQMKEREKKREAFWNKIGDKFSWLFRFIFLPSLLIVLIYTLVKFGVKLGWMRFLIHLGLALLIIAIFLGFIYLFEKFIDKVFVKINFKKLNPFKWKITNIIGEMIKTAYTKACPLITWQENTKLNEI